MSNERLAGVIAIIAYVSSASCAEHTTERSFPPAPPEAVPAAGKVAVGEATIGIWERKLRVKKAVANFRISTRPVTVRQYGVCVELGACGAPAWNTGMCDSAERGLDGRTFDAKGGTPDAPVTCVTPEQADAFCRWVGGRLPTIHEWLVAARGKEPRRFAWGNELPDCERHWRTSYDDSGCCGSACDAIVPAQLASRAAGRSPFGLELVEATRGEIVAADPAALWPACLPPARGCLVGGRVPGSIDSVMSVPSDAYIGDRGAPASGFRCVWEEG